MSKKFKMDFWAKYKLLLAVEGKDFYTCGQYPCCSKCIDGYKPCTFDYYKSTMNPTQIEWENAGSNSPR